MWIVSAIWISVSMPEHNRDGDTRFTQAAGRVNALPGCPAWPALPVACAEG